MYDGECGWDMLEDMDFSGYGSGLVDLGWVGWYSSIGNMDFPGYGSGLGGVAVGYYPKWKCLLLTK